MDTRDRLAEIGTLPTAMVIGAERVERTAEGTFETFDPGSGQVIATLPVAGRGEVEAAVAAARKALAGPWRDLAPAERGRILARTAALIRREAERLARLETLDCGKPLREARGDMATAAAYFEYYAGIADKLEGETIPLGRDYLSYTLHEPVGVTAHIIPWNFPLVTTARGLAPALAAGNTAVVKPAEQTPLSALALADLLAEAGLPEGVYNVVTGPGEPTGNALTAHPDVAHVTFTGSVATGRTVMRAAAGHIASVTLELGGKSPVVVLADADLEAAVEGTLKAIYLNAGQVCSAGSRLVVERPLHAPMLERLVAASEALTLGHGLDDAPLGPLISPEQLAKVAGHVEAARERGVAVATGGRTVTVPGLEGGWYYAPTILDQVDPADAAAREEIFGPVLCVQAVDSPEEALAVANDSPYGLVAGIYTRDCSRALALARDLEAGQVFINQYFAGGVATPFGGVKASGFGREKGLAALASYYRIKCVTARI